MSIKSYKSVKMLSFAFPIPVLTFNNMRHQWDMRDVKARAVFLAKADSSLRWKGLLVDSICFHA